MIVTHKSSGNRLHRISYTRLSQLSGDNSMTKSSLSSSLKRSPCCCIPFSRLTSLPSTALICFMMCLISFSKSIASLKNIGVGRGLMMSTKVVSVQSPPMPSSSTSFSKHANLPPALTYAEWNEAAIQHRHTLTELLYPPGENMKHRQHLVHSHPIYNFLHRYYRYSVEELYKYSPGYDVPMEIPTTSSNLAETHQSALNKGKNSKKTPKSSSQTDSLSEKFLVQAGDHCMHFSKEAFQQSLSPDGRYGWINIQQSYNILRNTQKRTAFVGCYGIHEWAMLYSGRKKSTEDEQRKRHQESLELRVSQEVIDSVVESSGIRCTHFDAWRFFHPDAQPMNVYNPMTRQNQESYEQPGCVHANMDLFKYAFQLYPLVSSDLLVRCLRIALKARTIDIRASPYDASMYEGCEHPLAVDTSEGKKQYVQEQEALAKEAAPVRAELLAVYGDLLDVNQELNKSHEPIEK